jgi:5-methyltetrahydropteroyltriglutamate--homocysteine methyltransferase
VPWLTPNASDPPGVDMFGQVGILQARDGRIRWNDLTDPVARDVDNLNSGGLERFCDTNFYYRRPTVVRHLQYQGGVLAEWTQLASNRNADPIRISPSAWR